MRILLAHCDHRPFEVERFGAAWEAAGGDPAELVPVTPRTAAAVLVPGRTWHGLLLTGGPDIEPWRYGQQPDPGLARISHRSSAARADLAALAGVLGDRPLRRTDSTPRGLTPGCAHQHRHLRPLATNPGEKCGLGFDPGRDALDLDLLERAAEGRWPVLGVCYGCQILAVAAGGSVVQDLPRAGFGGHRPDLPREVTAHLVLVSEDARWLQAGATILVNSRHHQSVALPGSLRVVGRAPDGVVEAVEGADPDRYVLGVQWHPEDLRTPEHLAVFRSFRRACAEKARGGATL